MKSDQTFSRLFLVHFDRLYILSVFLPLDECLLIRFCFLVESFDLLATILFKCGLLGLLDVSQCSFDFELFILGVLLLPVVTLYLEPNPFCQSLMLFLEELNATLLERQRLQLLQHDSLPSP